MASKEMMSAVLELRGLDLVTPVDLLANGRTPFAKNFRLFAQQSDDRRVAVSSRKGSGEYVSPLNELIADQNTSTTDESTAQVGETVGIHAQPFVAPSSNRVTRIDIKASLNADTSGPLMVQLWTDDGGKPAVKIAESSISSGDAGLTPAYLKSRFVNAPQLTSGDTYWIVLRIQDDGEGFYNISTTTDGTAAWSSDSSVSSLVEQDYAINYQLYTALDVRDKGGYRLNRDFADNRTLVAYTDTMYTVDESNGTLLPIISGLNVNATDYSFTNGDNKAFWVNGYDDLMSWDGTIESTNPNIVANPGFEVNTSGWSSLNSTIARSTSQAHTGVASLKIDTTTAGGSTGASYGFQFNTFKRYKVSFWVKASSGTNTASIIMSNQVVKSLGSFGTEWTKFETYYTPNAISTSVSPQIQIRFNQAVGTVYLDDVEIKDTGIEIITDPELPILSQITMHKDRLFGVTADDPNKLVFSENPGNPAYDPTGVTATVKQEQWYYAWLSVNFWYIPRPFNGSPITKIISFQDSLVVFTQDSKYILSGYDLGNLTLRQSTGVKGAVSSRGVAHDENRIYFVSDDGFYEFNGSSDEKISSLIDPLFDGCGHRELISPVIWKSQVRFYMSSPGSPYNDVTVIYDKDLKEMLYDTETYVSRALYYNDADDDQQLCEFSSLVPAMYFAEQGYHTLGAPIDFEYRLKYDSMGTPMQRKRIKRFYPILQGVDKTFNIQLAMDKDFEDDPKIKDMLLTVNGARVGDFSIGDGTLVGFDRSFKRKRQSYSGYANYWQLRVLRRAVDNRVAFVGAQFTYKLKRL